MSFVLAGLLSVSVVVLVTVPGRHHRGTPDLTVPENGVPEPFLSDVEITSILDDRYCSYCGAERMRQGPSRCDQCGRSFGGDKEGRP